ncbi:E3 ubiquitin-protein ligase SIAH1B [Orchesella cincta]|uniref:E3 ubiquitin-protein ligase SIAH1B n=1 Tax=Orchesella cincta TaxID=48709 RepID=A0A1D2NCJ8_ORCCI|nr:E3 ubiquitin-protein ligase SIAH1B [Orchesella cincta]
MHDFTWRNKNTSKFARNFEAVGMPLLFGTTSSSYQDLPRLTRCAICREPYTDSRNFPLEAIFNGCTIACKFWGRGCQQIVTGDKFVEHVKICQYRTLCCSHCHDSISPVDKYVDHLKEKHEATGYDIEQDVYTYKNCVSDLYNDSRFPDQYAIFDGRYFIMSAQIRSQFIHIWASIVENLSILPEDCKNGEPSEENSLEEIKKRAERSQYSAVISISSETLPVPVAVWRIPIYPLQNGEPDAAVIVNIPVNPTFRGFLTPVEPSPDDASAGSDALRKYSWSFTYSIAKVAEENK